MLLVVIITITIFSVVDSNREKWPAITTTSLLAVELVLCMLLHSGVDYNFIQKTTSIDIVFVLLTLWILSLAPHVEENDADQNNKA